MAKWDSFNIPDSLLGEQHVSESAYIKTYRTEVLLPQDSPYAGYYFLHPSKLISGKAGNATAILYSPDFVFTLIKKDREPGKRYKRYKLTVPEILSVYEAEMRKVEEAKERKERKRRAKIGSIYVLDVRRRLGYGICFVFHCGKKDYSFGSVVPDERDVAKRRVIADSVSWGFFEDIYPALYNLALEYKVFQDIRHALANRCPGEAYNFEDASVRRVKFEETPASKEVIASFSALCDHWEAEFHERAVDLVKEWEHKDEIINNKKAD